MTTFDKEKSQLGKHTDIPIKKTAIRV